MFKPHRYQDIIDIKHEKPYLTWTAAAREAGFEVGNFTASGRYTKDGKPIPQVRSGNRAGQSARRRLEMKLDKELIDEVERQEKLGNLNGNDYFTDRQRRLDEYKKELKSLREAGHRVDDGHLTTRKNSSPSARAPEPSLINQAKRDTLPQSDQDMMDAFLPRSDVEDLYQFMAPSQMPKVGIDERTLMLSGEISGEQAASLADRKYQLDQQSISNNIPIGAQLLLRVLNKHANPIQNGADLFMQGQSGSVLEQALNSIPDTSETDLGRHLGQAISDKSSDALKLMQHVLKTKPISTVGRTRR